MKKRILSVFLSLVLCLGIVFATPVSAMNIIRGDANLDGFVNVKDLLVLRKSVSALITLGDYALVSADCNGDNIVNLQDVLSLRNYLIKDGTLYKDPTWQTIRDWESDTVDETPNKILLAPSMPAIVSELGSNANQKNPESRKVLAMKANGLYYEKSINGTNPTCAYNANTNVPVRVQIIQNNSDTILNNATNLRLSMKYKPKNDELSVVYIGFSFKGITNFYYTRVTLESYNDFNYFYFVDKEYYKVETSTPKRRTFLENEEVETLTLTKEDVSRLKYVCFWMESDKGSSGSPFYIDDIEFYQGIDGYDSSVEDAALPQSKPLVDDGKDRYIAISFDDGPQVYSPTNTHYMEYYMDVAAKYNAKFSYFVGANQLTEDDIPTLKRAVDEGHALENHTIGHNRLTDLSPEAGAEKITAVDEWLYQKVGVKTNYIRPPYISVNANAYGAMEIAGMKAAIAGPCPQDYNNPSIDYKELYYEKKLGDGVISLNHEHYIDNVELIRRLLEHFTSQGYEFVTIDELFKIKQVTPTLDKVYYSVFD